MKSFCWNTETKKMRFKKQYKEKAEGVRYIRLSPDAKADYFKLIEGEAWENQKLLFPDADLYSSDPPNDIGGSAILFAPIQQTNNIAMQITSSLEPPQAYTISYHSITLPSICWSEHSEVSGTLPSSFSHEVWTITLLLRTKKGEMIAWVKYCSGTVALPLYNIHNRPLQTISSRSSSK